MSSQEQARQLTAVVLDAIRYRQWCGGNENPSLGAAILYVDKLLLPWARQELTEGPDDLSRDAENLLADAGVEAVVEFHRFRGTTGGEFFQWVKQILAQLIARVKRLREALAKGGLRRVRSLEREQETARLAELLISPEHSPEQAATIRENADRVRRAMRGLNLVERRVVKLRIAGYSLREIAKTLGHAPSWVQATWDSATMRLRMALDDRPAKTAFEAA